MGSLDETRGADADQVAGPDGASLLAGLAGNFRGQGLTAEFEDGRLRVADGPDGRGVALECRRRSGDFDRWWFTWAGGIWLCEADKPYEAMTAVKSALRRVGP